MENNHLTYFKIENFKKFDSLEVNDIGQFNLVVGDNNVGKTCFLEALLFDEDGQQLLNNFYIALTKRGFKFQIEEITTKVGNVSNTQVIYPKENYFKNSIIKNEAKEIKISAKSENKINISISPFSHLSVAFLNIDKKMPLTFLNKYNEEIVVSSNIQQFINIYIKQNEKQLIKHYWIYDYNTNILNFPLITFNSNVYEEETRSIYENLKTKREKQILIDTLKVINPKIVDIELRENFEDLKSVFLISFDDQDEFVPINFLGDGFKRIFYIVLKTISLKGKRIMIDEIEIGIHYTKLKDFWVKIIKVCKELDVQLFASTHSDECVKDYLDAANELGEQDLRLIRLQENKDKSVKAICYKKDYIEYIVESNTEER